jgi:enamine deaminase RidA (YjgF/YER057c/UK114 family)
LARRNISSEYAFEDAYGYSRAVRVANQVFVSGTTARPPHLDGDAYLQAKAALALIADVVSEAGAGMRHVVRTVVYEIDMADTECVARAHSEAFDAVRPARRRATKRRRSSITELAFHGIHTSHLQKSEKCNPCVRYELSPMSQAAQKITGLGGSHRC